MTTWLVDQAWLENCLSNIMGNHQAILLPMGAVLVYDQGTLVTSSLRMPTFAPFAKRSLKFQ